MTKAEILSLVKDELTGGDVNSDMRKRWHDEVIMAAIELALGTVMGDVSDVGLRFGDMSRIEPFIKAYKNVAIVEDTDRNEKYSVLPAKPVNLTNGRGIVLISGMQGQMDKFVRRANNDESILDRLEVGNIGTRTPYYREGDRVYYGDKLSKDISVVLMKLIVFEDLDDDDEIPLPAGRELQYLDFVFQFLRDKKPGRYFTGFSS